MLKPVKYNMKNCRKSFAVHVPLLWNELQAIVRLCYSLSLSILGRRRTFLSLVLSCIHGDFLSFNLFIISTVYTLN